MPASSDDGSSHEDQNGAASPGAEDVASAAPDNSSIPKPKRLACMVCRKRKLKCDGVRPSCSTCSRLGHTCAYNEQRRKSGPKRGYVKALEERLKHVETLLQTQDPLPTNDGTSNATGRSTNGAQRIHATPAQQQQPSLGLPGQNVSLGMDRDMSRWALNGDSPQPGASQAGGLDDFNFNANVGLSMDNADGGNFTWEMIGLGLEEPLPPQETIDELHQIYFEKVHPSMPMIHRFRYLAAMNLAPNQRPPVCLRYAMWTLACCLTERYYDMKELFYQRARKYVESDYVKGYGEHMISVAHCQAHILIATYEMKMMYFPRAWINVGSGVRLAQMIGLHRLDGNGLDVKQCLPPPKDWTEREERRRTFWMAFCIDRYASIGTGWPMAVDEQDIMTNLPASDEAFDMSKPEQTQTLQDSTGPAGASKLSSLGGIVLMACLFGRNLIHLHRPDADDSDHDLNGPFWKRHRQMDNILLNTSLCLPAHMKLPAGLGKTNVVFTNMSIHTSTICLHQAAIFKAEKNKLPASVSAESKVRCITAANEIASIMRTVSHMDLASMNPFIAFCLYVSARVFVQYLKSRPDDGQTADSLRFLLSAMNALKRRNPLTESFLVQLDVDLEALAIRIPKFRTAFARMDENPAMRIHISKDGFEYRNECHFMKMVGDDGNAANGPDLTESSNSRENETHGVFPGANWLHAEQGIPILTPSSGAANDRNGSLSGGMSGLGDGSGTDNPDGFASPEGGQSNGRTPNSNSNSSGMAGTTDARGRLAPGHMNGSGSNSFHSSPITQQNLLNQATGSVDMSNTAFFGSPSGFAMNTGMGDQQGAFSMSTNGWGEMPGQTPTNMQPVGDGVLRALMNMGPMDAMDLSSWDSGNDAMR